MASRIVHDDVFRRLCRARDLIHARPAEPLALSELARHAGISRFHFLRLFRLAFGATPHAYLTRVRLEQAKALLRADAASVTDICFDVGFSSLGSFSSLFARHVGCPPSAYRRRLVQVVRMPDDLAKLLIPCAFWNRYVS